MKIAIIDDGVDLDHVDLSGKASGDGLNYIAGQGYEKHGTQVASMAAASHNNTNGLVRGIDRYANIISYKITSSKSGDEGQYMGDSEFAKKVTEAVDNDNVDVINYSWGSSEDEPPSNTEAQAITYAYNMNTVFVNASNNDDRNSIGAPGNLDMGSWFGHEFGWSL